MADLVSVNEDEPCPTCGAPLRVLEAKPTGQPFLSGPNKGREAGRSTYRCEGTTPHCWEEALGIARGPKTEISLRPMDCPVPPTQS